MLTESYELLMFICFEVRGKNLDAREINPLLQRFRQQLERYKFEEREILAWPMRVDEFNSELVDSTWLLCSQQIRWTVYNPKGRSHSDIEVQLLNGMLSQKLEDKKVSIQMSKAIFSGNAKIGRWPEERLAVVTF